MDNAEKELLNTIADGIKDVRKDVKEVHGKVDTLNTSLNTIDKKVAVLEATDHSPSSCPAIAEHKEGHGQWSKTLKLIGWIFAAIVMVSGFILTIASLIGE